MHSPSRFFSIRPPSLFASASARLVTAGRGTRPSVSHRLLSQPVRSDMSNHPKPRFSVSPIPPNVLGPERYIQTAAALVIGDEILNGKTHDTNSNYFARWCFEHGVECKRIEVIADEEEQIIEASRRMVQTYDLVVTTGGIGSTHDDITYGSLAKAFEQALVHHSETLARMTQMAKHRHWFSTQTPQQRAATERMALFPNRAEVLFVAEDIWVPVVRLEGKLCIFPGIPSLFQKMLTALTPLLPLPPISERPRRIQVFTERPESMIAPYLTKLQARVKPHGVQVGSYPVLGQGVFVSLIGRERPITTTAVSNADHGSLEDIAKEVGIAIEGYVVTEEEVLKRKGQCETLQSPGEVAASLAGGTSTNAKAKI
ncbi:MoCF-biosynth domain-containing protein [Mycena indigotica]|uniref:MoCF-biosynth domain-containing protein n=1 Tax=Mycena indigotica TaxID=2126181 RepID=A0A8H6SCX3_9AGAR|nr:MoCF-biosynth domain-containing protein [Mycena indigotica]KAF7297124.1 MoCF-biosynth domain-containing protein [Mycena indigotica]